MMTHELTNQETYILVAQFVIMLIALYTAHRRKYLAAFLLSICALILSLINLRIGGV